MTVFDAPDGTTPIDPDEAVGLRLAHITTREELDRWESENILRAMDWLDRKKPKSIMNDAFIRQLHLKMFGDVWKWAGTFRKSDKNFGVSWHEVPVAVFNLCEDANLWVQTPRESADEVAVRFHHRLVWIHPFPNGNGRHARLMTDLILENVLGQSSFSWGGRNLARKGLARKVYIEALKEADEGDYGPLLRFARS